MRTSYFALQLGDLLEKCLHLFGVKPATDHKSRKRRDPAVRDIGAEGALYCAALSAQRAGPRERRRGADISKRLSPRAPYHSSLGNTVSPGTKICLPGRQNQICLRGRQNLSPRETTLFIVRIHLDSTKSPAATPRARARLGPKPSL
jgi:hypothetical protein